MARRPRSSGIVIPFGVILVVAAIGLGVFLHSRSGADAQTPSKNPSQPGHGQVHHARHHVVLFGISAPGFVTETARKQASQLARMKSIGMNAIRLDANWNWVQHAGPTSYHWGQLDREMRSVHRARMTADLVIDGCPPWAALPGERGNDKSQPRSAVQFATWARTVAARYGRMGVHIFEIWNEPNDSKYWVPQANPVFYARMLVDSYRAIKRVDRYDTVLVGGLAPGTTHGGSYSAITFLQDIYAHGAKGYFDALADHPYTFPVLPGTYEYWSAWSQMGETSPSLRGIMSRHGNGAKPIWVTEFGAPSNGPRGVGTSGQAAELAQAINIAKRTNWIAALFIYAWQDLGNKTWTNADWYGLLNFRGRPKPSFWAVKQAIGKP